MRTVLLIVGLLYIPGEYYPSVLQTHPEIQPPKGSQVLSMYRSNWGKRLKDFIASHNIFVRFECSRDITAAGPLMLAEFESPLFAKGFKKETVDKKQWMADTLKYALYRGCPEEDKALAFDVMVALGDRDPEGITNSDIKKVLPATCPARDNESQLSSLRSDVFVLSSKIKDHGLGFRAWGNRMPYYLSHKDLQVFIYRIHKPADSVSGVTCYALTFTEGGKEFLAVAADDWFNK